MQKIALIILFLTIGVMSKAELVANFRITTPGDSCQSRTLRLDASLSEGAIVNYTWKFTNLTTQTIMGNASGKSITRNLLSPGLYEVVLSVMSADGNKSETSRQIKVYDLPTVDFEATPTEGCRPTTIKFTDKSSAGDGDIVKWQWIFADGSNQTLTSKGDTQHSYSAEGKYSPTLIVTNSYGCTNSIEKQQYIDIYNRITPAMFVSDNYSCDSEHTVKFENMSEPLNGQFFYTWDFGDGTSLTSNDPNLTHHYEQQGTYVVTLTATNATGNCSSSTKTSDKSNVYIGKPNATFTVKDIICVNENLSLYSGTDTTGISNTGRWIFEDTGQKNEGKNTSHRFSKVGKWNVKYVAFNNYSGCYSDTAVQAVEVLPTPTANFVPDNVLGCTPPHTITVSNTSSDATKYSWNFGDGQISTSSDNILTHTYNNYGNFTITLTATNDANCSNSKTYNYVRISAPSISKVKIEPNIGCKPLPVTFNITASSLDPIVGYIYDYGNGTIDTVASSSHTYSYRYAGTYNPRVGIITSQGCVLYKNCEPITVLDICGGNGDGNGGGGGGGGGGMDGGWGGSCDDKYSIEIEDTLSNTEILFWVFDGDTILSTNRKQTYTFDKTKGYKDFLVTSVYYDKILDDTIDNKLYIKVIDEKANFVPSYIDICKHVSVDFKTLGIDSSLIAKFNWSFGDSTFLEIDETSHYNNYKNYVTGNTHHQYDDSGHFEVKLLITDINGCTDSLIYPDSIFVKGPTAGFYLDTNMFCYDTASIHFIDTSGQHGSTPIETWFWEFGDNTSETNTESTNPTHLYSNSSRRREFTAKLTVTDVLGCADSYSAIVTGFNPKANFYTYDALRCGKARLQMYNNSDAYVSNYANYTWIMSDGNSANDQIINDYHANFAMNDTGTYSISLIVKDDGGCFDTLTKPNIIQRVYPIAQFDVGSDTAKCVGTFTLPFTSTSQYVTNSSTYEWNFGDGTNSTTTSLVANHYYAEAGQYEVRLIATGIDGCRDTITKQIKIKGPRGTFEIDDYYLCMGDTLSGKVEGYNIENYFWDFDDFSITTDIEKDSIVKHIFEKPGEYTPNVILQSPEGCTITRQLSQKVFVDSINAGPTANFFCGDKTVELQGWSALNKSGNYYWEGPGNIMPNNKNLIVKVDKPGTYYLHVNNNLCSSVDSVIITSDGILPDLSAGPDIILDCIDSIATLTARIGTEVDTFYWEAPKIGAFVKDSTTLSPTVSELGYYKLTATNGICISVDSARITSCTLTPNDTIIWICANIEASPNTRANYNLHESDDAVRGISPANVTWYTDSLFTQPIASPTTYKMVDNTKLFAKLQSPDRVQTARAVAIFKVRDYIKIEFDDKPAICASAGTLQIKSPTPIGGTFSGEGISPEGLFPEKSVAKTYIIKYTYVRNDGCSNSINIDVVVNPLPQISFSSNPTEASVCAGQSISIDGGASGGQKPYTHQWTTDGGSLENANQQIVTIKDSVDNITLRTLTYTVTDNNGCKMSSNINVSFYSYPNIEFSAFGPFCIDADSAKLNGIATPLGGTWSGSGIEVNADFYFHPSKAKDGLHNAIYEVDNITVQNLPYGVPQCVSHKTMSILVNPLPIIELKASSDYICVFDTATISASGDVVFDWKAEILESNFDESLAIASAQNENSTLDGFTNRVSPWVGNYQYSVIGTDSNSCQSFDTIALLVRPLPDVNIDTVLPLCVYVDEIELSAHNEDNGIGSFAGVGVTNSNHFDPKISGDGLFNIIYSYENDFGCRNQDSTHIRVNPRPKIDISTSPTDVNVCSGETISLDGGASGGPTPFVHEWTADGGSLENANSQTPSFSAQVDAITKYKLIYKLTDNNTCEQSDSIDVWVYPYPVIELGNDTTICDGEYVHLDPKAQSPISPLYYEWNVGTNSSTINATKTGIYDVKVDDGRCASFDTIAISVTPLPIFDFGQPKIICDGESWTFNAPIDNANYKWNSGEQTRDLLVSEQKDYVLTITKNDCSYSDTATLILHKNPIVNLGNDADICIGESIILDATYPNVTYHWNDNSTNAQLQVNRTGTYSVTITDDLCSASDTINVIVHLLPEIDLGRDTSICTGDFITLKATNGMQKYLWNTGRNSQEISISKPQIYSVTVTDEYCSNSDEIKIDNIPIPSKPIANDRRACIGEYDSISANGIDIKWYADEFLTNLLDNKSTFLPSQDSAGTYYYYATQTINLCESKPRKVKYQLFAPANEMIEINGNNRLCIGSNYEKYTINCINDYRWKISGDNVAFQNTESTIYIDWDNVGVDTLSVYSRDTNNCPIHNNFIVAVAEYPHADFDWEQIAGTCKVTYENLSSQNKIIEGDTIIDPKLTSYWNFGRECDIFDLIYTPDQFDRHDTISYLHGDHTTQLIVQNDFGCSDTISETFFIEEKHQLFVPSIFCPTHFKHAIQLFSPVGFNLATYDISIFDKWGNLIWHSDKLTDDGMPAESWNGTYQGVILEAETYIWKINATFTDGVSWKGIKHNGEYKKYGSVILLK